MEEILLNKPKKKIILLGNEAIVRGALEAGLQFVSTYPGTPASEIGNTFYKIQSSKSKIQNLYFEFSTNEKVALEAGIGASFSGLKTLVAMKSFGLNVCLDALLPFLYTGTKGPFVMVVADDPSCHSSAQSEENTRVISYLAHLPTLEPADPQECKDFTKLAFQISEKFKVPVMIRTTTRVAHQRAPVNLGKIKSTRTGLVGRFVKEPKRFVTLPPRVLEMKKELLEKIEKIKEFSEKSPLNINYGSPTSIDGAIDGVGIITSGISYLYVMEALKELNLSLPVLKLGFFYPLPEKKIRNFIKNFKKVLIVEELEPYLEKEVERLAKDINPKLEVVGRNLLPEVGELKPEIVTSAIAKFTNTSYKIQATKYKIQAPKRFPQLCPGCPYWLVFGAVKKAIAPKNAPKQQKLATGQVVFGGDIGCYMLAGLPPHFLQDYLSCMGSSVGIAHGIKKATQQKLITFIGDSTFFHAGIPALINTVFNKSNPLIIIMDNQTTAMTGLQPHPGAPVVPNGIHPHTKQGQDAKGIKVNEVSPCCGVGVKIEEIVKACGVNNLKVIDPVNQKEFIETVKDFLTKKEASVIISRRPCIWVKK